MTFYPSRTVEFFYFHCGGYFRTVNAFSSIFPYTRLMHRYIRADSANGITIRLRSALQRNLIAFTVMWHQPHENYHRKSRRDRRGDRCGEGRKQNIRMCLQNVFRSTLENIIEYHRMFSNLLSHVKRMRIKSSFLPPFFSFSFCFHFYFSEYPRGNFITYIAKYFHELRAPGMPV